MTSSSRSKPAGVSRMGVPETGVPKTGGPGPRLLRAGVLILAATGAVVLAGCEQHPYPTPAPDESAAPPQPPSQLMGAPEGAGGPPPQPAYPPAQAYGPPAGAPAQPIGRAPCAPDPDAQGPNAPTVIICSTPVPNPPEHAGPEHAGHAAHGWRHRHHHAHWGHRHHHWGWSGRAHAQAAAGPSHHRRRHHLWTHGQAAPVTGEAAPQHAHRAWPASPAAHAPATHHHAAPAPKARVAAVPVAPVRAPHHVHLTKPVPPAVKPAAAARVHRAAPAGAASTTANTSGEGGNTVGTLADRYGALQSALAGAVARGGRLDAPSHFDAGRTVEVSLTLPADFVQTLQADAAQQGLGDAAASVNMTSTLSGDGYVVTPDQPQSLPLALGQPIVFHWKVTPQAAGQGNVQAGGPIQASVSADLLSQGRSLPLGTLKAATAGRAGGRILGLGLLVVIAAVVLGWAMRRRRPTLTGASRPRANHQNGEAA